MPTEWETIGGGSAGAEHYAQITAELARDVGADVVVGSNMGATVLSC